MASDSCMRLLGSCLSCCLMDFLIDLVVAMEEVVGADVGSEGFGSAFGCRNCGRDVCGMACVHQCCIGMRWLARIGKDGCGSGGYVCCVFSACCAMVSASSFHGLPLCPLT